MSGVDRVIPSSRFPWRLAVLAMTTAIALTAESFLAGNAKADGVKVLPSGLQYKILSTGAATGSHPGPTDEVKVDYVGSLTNGTVFDSSVERGVPAVMGLADLVPAWMVVDSLWRAHRWRKAADARDARDPD